MRLATVNQGRGRVVNVAVETKKTTRGEEDVCNDRGLARDEEVGEWREAG